MRGVREHAGRTVFENFINSVLPAPLPWKSGGSCSASSTVEVSSDVTGFVKKFEVRIAILVSGLPSFEQAPPVNR